MKHELIPAPRRVIVEFHCISHPPSSHVCPAMRGFASYGGDIHKLEDTADVYCGPCPIWHWMIDPDNCANGVPI